MVWRQSETDKADMVGHVQRRVSGYISQRLLKMETKTTEKIYECCDEGHAEG